MVQPLWRCQAMKTKSSSAKRSVNSLSKNGNGSTHVKSRLYGILPEQAKTFTLTGKAESGITVTVTGDSTSLPCLAGDVKVVVRDLDESEQQELDAKLAENEENQESLESEEEEPEVRYLLDISLWQGEIGRASCRERV